MDELDYKAVGSLPSVEEEAETMPEGEEADGEELAPELVSHMADFEKAADPQAKARALKAFVRACADYAE